MAKKPAVKKDELPASVLAVLKKIKNKYFKEDSLEEVKQLFIEELKEQKEQHKDQGWNDSIFYRRATSTLKNKKKREKLGGTVDKYYGIVLGYSKVRDLSASKRAEILKKWENDPNEALYEGIIMTVDTTNPQTGEIERSPLLDNDGGIIPRDNREFFNRADGSQFKNPNYGNALARAYRKSVIGVCSNIKGEKGAFLMELRDSTTELEIPLNNLIKFSGRTINSNVVLMEENKFIDKNLLEEMVENLDFDIEQGFITKEYAKILKGYYNKLINDETFETNFFNLRSSRGSYFTEIESKKDFEQCGFDKDFDINLLYKEYLYPFTCDCSNLLEYHNENRFEKDKDGNITENINWDEFVVLQDVNLIQLNTEASVSGNFTFYVEDETLFNKEVIHLETEIDSIRLLVPSHIELDFGQDSKLNVIGAPAQFQAQDEENKPIFEEIKNDDGKIEKIPILDFPMIIVYGIFAIKQYKVEVETLDLTLDEEIDTKKIIEETNELTDEELEEMEKAVEKVKETEENEEIEVQDEEKTEETTEDAEPDDLDVEPDEEDEELW